MNQMGNYTAVENIDDSTGKALIVFDYANKC